MSEASPPLLRNPERIIIIDPHNWGKIGVRARKALRTVYKEVIYIRPGKVVTELVKNAYSKPKCSLILYIEPGFFPRRKVNKNFHLDLYPVLAGVRRPKNLPFGLLWNGSIYRVENVIRLGQIKKSREWFFVKRREYLNSLTPIRMVATECLMNVSKYPVEYLGQPYKFPDELPDKPDEHKCIHIPTNPLKTNVYKGTGRIRNGFSMQDEVETEIIEFGTPNPEVLEKLEHATMYAMTMTGWNSGLGYGGIEAISRGCLVFSRKPESPIETPIVDVRTPKELAEKIQFYADNRDEYEKKRAEQFGWASANLSYNAVGRRFKKIVESKVSK